MKRNQPAIRIPGFVLLVVFGMATFPGAVRAEEDTQADREARRIEGEVRRQQELGRRNIEDRERVQAEALRGQEEAIRRMEATRSRIEANTPQFVQQPADQARIYAPVTPEVRALLDRARNDDPVSGMNFAPLSERLKSYFGAESGVLVVSAGVGAPFGLQDGDVVISIDGRVPTDAPHLAGILRSYKPGERVKLKVQRDRRTIDLDTAAPGQRSN